MGVLQVVTIFLWQLLQSRAALAERADTGAGWRATPRLPSGVSHRPHTPVRTRRTPRNPPESLVGRQGLEPWTLGLKAQSKREK